MNSLNTWQYDFAVNKTFASLILNINYINSNCFQILDVGFQLLGSSFCMFSFIMLQCCFTTVWIAGKPMCHCDS